MAVLVTPGGVARSPVEQPLLRLDIQKFNVVSRGIRVIGTWTFKEPAEPCLVLLPRDADPRHAIGVCAVALSSAFLWSPDLHIGNPIHCAFKAVEFAPLLGLDPNSQADVNRIVDVVQSRLADLYAMPPTPRVAQRSVGQIDLLADGQVIETRDLKDDS